MLLWCVRDFYVSGKGTLAPWAPPERLVLLGWVISFGSLGLFVYTVIVATAFHLRVVFGEEPWLARTHGGEWERYVSRVSRWF